MMLRDDRISAACCARELAASFSQLAERLERGEDIPTPVIQQLTPAVSKFCVAMALLPVIERTAP